MGDGFGTRATEGPYAHLRWWTSGAPRSSVDVLRSSRKRTYAEDGRGTNVRSWLTLVPHLPGSERTGARNLTESGTPTRPCHAEHRRAAETPLPSPSVAAVSAADGQEAKSSRRK